jgi:glycosyltransferase involved in cell wall biosynthesis
MSNKKKVLVLADHPFSPSGVGTQTNYFIQSLLATGKYSFICLGGAVKHADYRPLKTEKWGDDLLILPVDGYGTQQQVRDMIHAHKFDAVWFMTDPRFWGWLWQIEQEIRPNVPMIYYHVWDNYPYPTFNRASYLSNDMVVTMSKVSSDIVRTVAPEVEEIYIPLCVDTNIFKPLPESDWAHLKPKGKTLFFWNNRNARRKMSGTILWWFKEFLDVVGHDKAMLLMHTDPKDVHGQDLEAIARELNLTREQFVLSTNKVPAQELAKFYNAADCILNISDAEGVGMGTIESMACETPIIVNMTGGLQEQVTDGEGNWFGIGIQPASKAIIGSQEVPFIYEDRVSKQDFINALIKMHNMTHEERKEIGKKARQYVLKKYDLDKFGKQWEQVMDSFIEKNGSWQTRKNYTRWTLKEF